MGTHGQSVIADVLIGDTTILSRFWLFDYPEHSLDPLDRIECTSRIPAAGYFLFKPALIVHAET